MKKTMILPSPRCLHSNQGFKTTKSELIFDPYWLVGFVDGDGSFMLSMYNTPDSKSAAFLACQTRDKTGANNPQFAHPPPHTCVGWGLGGGVKKSEETLAKLFPLNPIGARYTQGLFYIL